MEISNKMEAEEKEINIAEQLVTKYLAYWPLFIMLMILSVAGAFAYLRYATPVYEASATLIIKDESKGTGDAQITQLLNLVSSKKNIENEMEVLKSRALMEKVAKELYLYAPVTQVGTVKSGDGYVLSPVFIEVKDLDSVLETEKVNFIFDKKSQTIVLENQYRYPLDQFVNTPFGTLKFIPNKYYFPSATKGKRPFYFSIGTVEGAAIGLLKRLTVTPNKQSAIVDVVFKDPIPQRAVDIINTLIRIYNQVSIREKNTAALNTLEFIDKQLLEISNELDSIERKVQLYKSGKGAVDISSQGTRYLSTVSDNDQKLDDLNLQLSILGEVEKFVVNNQKGNLLAPSTLGLKDNSLSLLLTQLQSTEIEFEKLGKSVGGNNPTLLALGEQSKKLRSAIIENIQSQKQSLLASKQSIESTNSSYNSLLSTVPQKEQQLLEISREQLTKNNQYQFLLEKKQEAEMALASVVSNSRIVDKALVSKDPVSPKKAKIYLIFLFGSIVIAIGMITARDMLTTKIKYRSDIEKMVSIPIVGEISYKKSKTPLVIEKGTRDFVSESFRKLRISLPFLGINNAPRKILLTSSISGEGKSFVASNLAVTVSMIGKKVVLVDLDLNHPTLSDIMDVNYEKGVTEYLKGELAADQIINKLEAYDNLYFVSAGSLPENPTELLANGKIPDLINYLESQFDIVIIDTSPSYLVTDAYILSSLCDVTLYVVRHGYTPKMLIKRIDENHKMSPFHNPAIVYNGVKTRGVLKYGYGYSYNYVYDNKYGKKTKRRKAS